MLLTTACTVVTAALIFGLFFLGGKLERFLRAHFSQKHSRNTDFDYASGSKVSFDENNLHIVYANGIAISIRWQDLSAVDMQTTDDGPLLPDVFWCFHTIGKTQVVVCPQEASGSDALLSELQKRLPGFNHTLLIQAMGSTEHALFTVWTRDHGSVQQP